MFSVFLREIRDYVLTRARVKEAAGPWLFFDGSVGCYTVQFASATIMDQPIPVELRKNKEQKNKKIKKIKRKI